MVAEVDQFNRSQYQNGVYSGSVGGDNCFSGSAAESLDISSLQQREWEMRVYNQMHGAAPIEADYLFAARKVQVRLKSTADFVDCWLWASLWELKNKV